jgi:hypothetical protein
MESEYIIDKLLEGISENEREDLIRSVLHEYISEQFKLKEWITWQGGDVLLGNASYEIARKMVGEAFGEVDYNNVISEKVVGIINNLTSYSVFNYSNSGLPISEGARILDKTLKSSEDLIASKISAFINSEKMEDVIAHEVPNIIEKILKEKLGG